MTFTEPISFDEAIKRLEAKGLLPTELSSRELQQHVSAALRERAFFSARVANAQILQGFKDGVTRIVQGASDLATQRRDLKDLLDSLGYEPDEEKAGTIQDLGSNSRLNLILRMNTAMVRSFGAWQQGNQPGALDAFPAQQLIRVSARANKRDWIDRWNDAREDLGDETTATEADGDEDSDDDGINAIAMKSDPIWSAISAFGLPYPPFDFNSGMGLEDVAYEDAVAAGVMNAEDDPIQPEPITLNQGLESSTEGLDADLVSALLHGFGDAVHLVDGVLKLKNDAGNLRNRCVLTLALLNEAIANSGTPEGAKKGWDTRREAEKQKGIRAIKTALQTKRDAISAMQHPELGAIDFPLEKRGGKGLLKIVADHGEESALQAPHVIAYGKLEPRTGNTQLMTHEGRRVVLTKSEDKDRRHWLLTSYDEEQPKKEPLVNSRKDFIPASLRSPGLHWARPEEGAVADSQYAACREEAQVLRDRGATVLRGLQEAMEAASCT